MRMTSLASLTVGLLAVSGGVSAQSGLHNETDINDRLLIVSVVDKINRGCDSIGVKFFKAQRFVNDLKSDATSLGYSRQEVNSYIENKANRAEMRKRRNAYFNSKGASNLDPQSLCVLGHAEIKQQSRIGTLLRAK
ncbi:DUF5333 domain-containing protein [Roseovarius sp. CAU 1744]|uniref:DUF5333 domain-containing protein n=1 Tax=Roseovarius sp. CAU 1744 TaxID=3140368 RepID=UPI00325B4283